VRQPTKRPNVVVVSFTLTDNQLGDDSGAVNLIVEPGGAAMALPKGAPAASHWSLFVIATALVGVGSLLLSRQRLRTSRAQ
jgi:hypothetical protein